LSSMVSAAPSPKAHSPPAGRGLSTTLKAALSTSKGGF